MRLWTSSEATSREPHLRRGGGEKGRKGEQELARVQGTCHIRSFAPHRDVEAALQRLHFTDERTEAECGAVTLGKCRSQT